MVQREFTFFYSYSRTGPKLKTVHWIFKFLNTDDYTV